jgi:Mn-dependent DtxR family transcriptional regulator
MTSLMPTQPSLGDLALPPLLTIKDIMRLLQVGERQAYEIAHSAGTVRLGRSLRVRPEDLSAYLQRLAVRGLAEYGL